MVDPQRIAEIRAAMAADRAQQWADFRRQWPMVVLEVVRHSCLGVALGLALVLYVLRALA